MRPPAAQYKFAPVTATSPARLSLIVIEDSADDYELILRRIGTLFPDVFAQRVESAAALVEVLGQREWSAVLSDHRLPGFSSHDALAIVRARTRDLPFVIVSGAIGEDAVVESMHAGADDFVMKDRLGRLGMVLTRALQSAEARARQRKIEAAYQESEARLRAVASNLPGMMFRIDIRDGRVSFDYVSEGARRLFGLAPDDVMRDATLFFQRFSTEDAGGLLTALHHTIEGDGFITWTASICDPGAVEWVQVEAESRQLGPRHVVWDGLVIDVTAAKRAENSLRESRQEMRELARHQAQVREEERDVVARELHDDVGSMLTGVRFETAWLKSLLKASPEADDALKQLDELVEGAILACNRIMHDLHPAILEQGIVAALEWQARKFGKRIGVECRFHPPAEEIEMDSESSMAMFRICQEALNNVAKHACARKVDVVMTVQPDIIALSIADDGIGLTDDAIRRAGRFGLRGMRERALALGGNIAINSSLSGTTITLTLPPIAPPSAELQAAADEAPGAIAETPGRAPPGAVADGSEIGRNAAAGDAR